MKQWSKKKIMLRRVSVPFPFPMAALPVELMNNINDSSVPELHRLLGRRSGSATLPPAGWEFIAALVLFMVAHMSLLPANIKLI